MVANLLVLADLLLQTGVLTLALSANEKVHAERTHVGELDSDPKVASLDACIRNLRQVFARHELKLRLKPAARKCLHAKALSAGEVCQVLQDNIGAPLARMIQAGEIAEGNTIVIDCIMDDIVLRAH